MTETIDDTRDPEQYCVCGHHRDEHAQLPSLPEPCMATKPDNCSCQGYRQGSRFQRST